MKALTIILIFVLAAPIVTMPSVAAEVIAGVTTQQQMMDSFGEPKTIINEPDGRQTWIYPEVEVEPTLSLDEPQPRTLNWLLRFNEYGVLIEHRLVADDGSWVGESPHS